MVSPCGSTLVPEELHTRLHTLPRLDIVVQQPGYCLTCVLQVACNVAPLRSHCFLLLPYTIMYAYGVQKGTAGTAYGPLNTQILESFACRDRICIGIWRPELVKVVPYQPLVTSDTSTNHSV